MCCNSCEHFFYDPMVDMEICRKQSGDICPEEEQEYCYPAQADDSTIMAHPEWIEGER